MAEIQANDHGDGKKNKQKKQHLRVDFTPMVDMNMLLITFFMFCTTLLKPSTMTLNMPSKDTVKKGEETEVKASGAITLLLGGNNEIYYYEGMPEDEKTKESHYEDPNFLQVTSYNANGLHRYLVERNSNVRTKEGNLLNVYQEIKDLKKQLQDQAIPDSIFRIKQKEITDKAKEDPRMPTVMIKPTDFATYENLVDALDEMLVTNIGSYAIIDLQEGDRYLLFKKTGDPKYLSEEQLAQGVNKR